MSRRLARLVGIAGCLLILGAARRPAGAVCAGDCDANGSVAIREVQACINIYLGAPLSGCPNCDQNGDGSVGIGDLQAAVSSFLDASGCPQVTPVAGASPTPTTTAVSAPTNTPSTAPTATATTAPTNTPPPTRTNTVAPTATNTLPGNTATSAPSNTPTSTPSATRTNTVAAPPTNTSPANTATPTATRTRTPTRPTATATRTPTSATPALGLRVFGLNFSGTVGPGTPTPKTVSAFFSSLSPGSQGVPVGTLALSAGPLDASGHATVSLANGPAVIQTDLRLGGLTLCTRLESCTGTVYCNGGTNVDVLVSLDSLKPGLTCTHDGTNACPIPPTVKAGTPTVTPFPCCSDACEGVCPGAVPTPTPGGPVVSTPTPCNNSGNSDVNTVAVNSTDSGAGALVMVCMQRSAQVPLTAPAPTPGDCTPADYSTASLTPQYYTTGNATAQVLNHCVGGGAVASKVPKFAKVGTNFDCTNWTTTDGAGVFAFAIPSEEGSSVITGDGANAGLWSDK